jgi:hypothetical protein
LLASSPPKNTKPPNGGVYLVDFASIDWHQVSAEYLEFSAIAKDFFYYLKIPESFHYPLSGTSNTNAAGKNDK